MAGCSVFVSELGFGSDGDIDGGNFGVAAPWIVEWVVIVGDGDSVAAASFAHVEPSSVDNPADDERERFDPQVACTPRPVASLSNSSVRIRCSSTNSGSGSKSSNSFQMASRSAGVSWQLHGAKVDEALDATKTLNDLLSLLIMNDPRKLDEALILLDNDVRGAREIIKLVQDNTHGATQGRSADSSQVSNAASDPGLLVAETRKLVKALRNMEHRTMEHA